MNSSASVKLRYEKCLLIWGNARHFSFHKTILQLFYSNQKYIFTSMRQQGNPLDGERYMIRSGV